MSADDSPLDDEGGPFEGMDPGRAVILAALVEGSLAPVALVLGALVRQSPLETFAWSGHDALIGAAATLPMLAMLAVVVRWPVGPLGRIRRFFDTQIRPLLQSRPWHDLALVSLAAGVGEEMMFRGVVQGWLGRSLGDAAGLALTSALFGLLHPITPTYACLAAGLGAYLGALWLLTGNLLSPMIAHGVYDFVALLVLLRGGRHDAE